MGLIKYQVVFSFSWVFAGLVLPLACFGQGSNSLPMPPPITAVRVVDSFWAPKQQIYRTASISNSWQFVQEQMDDNELVAGVKRMARRDVNNFPWNQATYNKFLEACAYALAQQRDPKLEQKLDGLIAATVASQGSNGYCNATITARRKVEWGHLDGQHDGYSAGHIIEAAIAHYQTTGKRTYLDAACKIADHTYDLFMTQGKPGADGHAELELALVRLYWVTGRQRYLDLAREWVERRGHAWPHETITPHTYFMAQAPVREQTDIQGHAVRSLFYLQGVADVANACGDESLKVAARRLWNNLTKRKLFVVGSVGTSNYNDDQHSGEGFGPDYELPNYPTPGAAQNWANGIGAYTESCGSCAMINLAQSMFQMDGDAEAIDILECSLYNAVLHGISLDGLNSYYQNPLTDANNPRYNSWICCPPNLNRTLLRLPEYIYASNASNVWVNLFVGGVGRIRLPQGFITVKQETQYPWDGTNRITVSADQDMPFTLRVRMPGWCTNGTLSLSGSGTNGLFMEKGYACFTRTWSSNDVLLLDLPMPVRRIEAHPSVVDDRGRVAVQRGPLVYAFEGLDNSGATDLTLPADPQFVSQYQAGLLGGIVSISGKRSDGQSFTALPFYVMANRGNSSQFVWARQLGKLDDAGDWTNRLYREWSPAVATEPVTWTAYNDFGWESNQTSYRITTYVPQASPGGGQFIDYASGSFIAPSISMAMSGGLINSYTMTSTVPAVASDAYNIFNGFVDCGTYQAWTSGVVTLTFTNLLASRRYEVAIYGNRGITNYTDRWTQIVLSGATNFVNQSSTGATISTTVQAGDTTRIITGINNAGLVFRYGNIAPAANGTFLMSITGSGAPRSSYLNALRIQTVP